MKERRENKNKTLMSLSLASLADNHGNPPRSILGREKKDTSKLFRRARDRQRKKERERERVQDQRGLWAGEK